MENKEENQGRDPSSESAEVSEPEDAEALPPYREVSAKPRKKFSVPYTGIFIILVFAGVAAVGFFLHQKQEEQRREMLVRMDQLEAKLGGLESDRKARKALRRELAVFQGDTAEAINKQENAIRNINGEIARLLQAMEQQEPEQTFDVAEAHEENAIAVDDEGDVGDEEIAEAPRPRSKNAVKRSQETQDYIDLVESTFEKFIRLSREGFVKLWDYFSGLIEKFIKF